MKDKISKMNLHPYSLEEVWTEDVGYVKEEALLLLDFLHAEVLPVLGGEVFFLKDGHVEFSQYVYEGWSCDRMEHETLSDYVHRSYLKAKDFITHYKAKENIPLFCIAYCDDIYKLINEEWDQ